MRLSGNIMQKHWLGLKIDWFWVQTNSRSNKLNQCEVEVTSGRICFCPDSTDTANWSNLLPQLSRGKLIKLPHLDLLPQQWPPSDATPAPAAILDVISFDSFYHDPLPRRTADVTKHHSWFQLIQKNWWSDDFRPRSILKAPTVYCSGESERPPYLMYSFQTSHHLTDQQISATWTNQQTDADGSSWLQEPLKKTLNWLEWNKHILYI